jgi:hypothetical protein
VSTKLNTEVMNQRREKKIRNEHGEEVKSQEERKIWKRAQRGR